MTYKSNRPIAAYSMAEFESLTRTAEFARPKGAKDKAKRKSRTGLYAGIGAGATALAGLGRYGAAELASRKAIKDLDKSPLAFDKKGGYDWKKMKMDRNTMRNATSGGAAGLMQRDMDFISKTSKKIGDWMGNPISKARAAYDSSSISANVPYSNLKSKKSVIDSTGSLGNRARQTSEAVRNVIGTRAGKLGIGALGAAALAGGGYGIYKSMKNKSKKK